MAVTYGFFDSVNGDRKYNADTMSEFYNGICSQGVFQSVDNGLAVSAGTGLTVNVATGRALIQNHWVKNDSVKTLTVSAASATYARIDAVVIRYSKSNRSISILMKDGTAAASPSAPSMTRNSDVYELCLAYVNVAANATSVTVTDKRSDTGVCGWAAVAQAISGTYEAMIDDIKTGFDGVVYNSPGDAVRGSDQELQNKINEAIDQIETGFSKVYPTFTTEKAIRVDNGNIQILSGYSTWAISDFIPIPSGVSRILSNAVSAATAYGLAFYDSSKNFISGSSLANYSSFNVAVLNTYKFLRFTSYNANSDHSGLYVQFNEQYGGLPGVVERMDNITADSAILISPFQTVEDRYCTVGSGNVLVVATLYGCSVSTYDVQGLNKRFIKIDTERFSGNIYTIPYLFVDSSGIVLDFIKIETSTSFSGFVYVPDGAKNLYINHATSGNGQSVGFTLTGDEIKEYIPIKDVPIVQEVYNIYVSYSGSNLSVNSSSVSFTKIYKVEHLVNKPLLISVEKSTASQTVVLFTDGTTSGVLNAVNLTDSSISNNIYYVPTGAKTMYINCAKGGSGASVYQFHNHTLLPIEQSNHDYFVGKSCICFGDSLTWYDGNQFTWGEHQGEVCVGFESYLRNQLNMLVTNEGISGTTTPQISARIKTHSDLSNYEVMTIMGGDNDDRLGVALGTLLPPGSTFNTDTVYGALQSAVEYALTENPNLRIIIMTEPMGWTYRNNVMDRVDADYPNAYRRVAEQYGLPIIDNWSMSGINENTRETFYCDPAPSDNQLYMYHPNNDGWFRISRVICNAMREL